MLSLPKLGEILLHDENFGKGEATIPTFYILAEQNPELNVTLIDEKIRRIVEALKSSRVNLPHISHQLGAIILAVFQCDIWGRMDIFLSALEEGLWGCFRADGSCDDRVVAANAIGYLIGALRILTETERGVPGNSEDEEALRFMSVILKMVDRVAFAQVHFDIIDMVIAKFLRSEEKVLVSSRSMVLRSILCWLDNVGIPTSDKRSFVRDFAWGLHQKTLLHLGAPRVNAMLLREL